MNPIKKITPRWDQYFDPIENKEHEVEKYSFKISLPRHIIRAGQDDLINSLTVTFFLQLIF